MAQIRLATEIKWMESEIQSPLMLFVTYFGTLASAQNFLRDDEGCSLCYSSCLSHSSILHFILVVCYCYCVFRTARRSNYVIVIVLFFSGCWSWVCFAFYSCLPELLWSCLHSWHWCDARWRGSTSSPLLHSVVSGHFRKLLFRKIPIYLKTRKHTGSY